MFFAVKKSGILGYLRVTISVLSLGLLAPFLACVSKPSIYIEMNNFKSENILRVLTINNRQSVNKTLKFRKKDKKSLLNNRRISLRRNEEKNYDDSFYDYNKKMIYSTRAGIQSYFKILLEFLNSPCIIFYYDTCCYILFLCVFSFFIMSDFRFQSEHSSSHTNQSINGTMRSNLTDKSVPIKNPSTLEYVLIIWIFSFMLEELRQFFQDGKYNYFFI